MQSLNGPFRINEVMRALLWAGSAFCLLFAATLYGSSITAAALAGPAAPSGLTATAVSSSQINLAWTDNAGDETGFKIERKTGAAGTYVQIATVGANEKSFSNISGISQNTLYFYRVRAYNANGNSAFSNEAGATTIPSSPAPPNNLAATAASNARIDLAWADNSNNEDGFKIEIKAGASGTYAEIATVGANVTSYSSTGLVANTQYYYRLRAFNGLGSSSYSNQAIATTLPDPPAVPSGLTATTVSNTRINLAWVDNSGNETGFKIEFKLGSAVTYTEIATVGANVTSYSSTGLAVNTAYNFRVRAYNAGGNSVYSNVASATTLPNTPAAPSALTATAVSNNRIDLAWQDNATDELGFIIERKTGAAGAYAAIDTVGANVKTYSSLGLVASTQYFYQVRAYNAGGNSAYSNAANATTKIDPPAAPSNLQAIAASNIRINLTWIDNANNENGFKIERKTGAGGTYAEIAMVGANVVSYSSNGLAASTQYFYRVRAFNLTGRSSYSNEANATTRPDPPAAPSNLQAAAVSNVQINLTWTDNSANESGFKIERKLSSAATYAQIALVGANVTTYLNTGLSANTAYSYRVRAYNANGHSVFSNTANATTLPNPPAAPGGLAATTVSKNQIDLVWADSSNNENGFKIERKLNSAATYTEIATVGANVTSYSSLGLNANTAYSYRVRAYNTGGNSAYSNVAGATTLPNSPNAPSVLAATAVSNNRINLAWQDNAGNELGFIIERKIGAVGTYAVIDTVGANVKTYASLGLAASTEYFYQVRAYNAGGNSAYSNAANATTQIDPPSAPSNLAATAVGNTQINLTWTDNAGSEDGFKIELKIGPAGTYAEIATVGANVASYSSTGLDVSTQYFYRVRAFNLTSSSSYSNEANATTLPDLPETPSDLQAAAASNVRIDLTWTDNATNEDGFKIERKLSSTAAYTQIATVGANVATYSSTGLTQNTAYSYRVRAFNASGNSAYSNGAGATTLPNSPAGPSVLAAVTVSSSQINLSWQDNANNELGFIIRRKTGAGGTYAVIDTVGANVTSYASLGLTASTQYFYQVRAYNAGGVSALSNEANATTASDPLAAPGNLTAAAASSARINLAWLDNSNNETGFKIERKLGAAGTYAQIATVGANVTSYSNTGLNANTAYFYRVRAYNVSAHSDYSNEANATTLPTPPQAPGNLTVTSGNKGQLNLVWADSSNNEDGFKIERKASAGGTFGQIATVGPNVTSYANTGLGANTTYYYRVRAFNAGGHSAYTNEANATTLPNPPKAPGNLIATAVNNSQINLTWADSSNNEDGFKIERRLSTDAAYAEIATVGSGVTNFSSTGLNANSKYFYRVRAFNTGGNSAYSTAANATTSGAKSASNHGGNGVTSDATLPEAITLAQNYPNPFNPGTMISFTLPAAGKVTLQIFAETGQLVRTLVDGDLSPGIHHVRWNGRNQSGRVAAAGAYLYRLVVQGSSGEVLFAQSRPMMMLK